MHGRKPEKFELKPKDKAFLQQLLRDGQTPLKTARRVQILLYRADPRQRVRILGEKVEQNASTVKYPFYIPMINRHASQSGVLNCKLAG